MTDCEILKAIPSTEPCSFSEFLRGLPEIPEQGEWAPLMAALSRLEHREGLIETERLDLESSRIQSIILTDKGIRRVRECR